MSQQAVSQAANQISEKGQEVVGNVAEKVASVVKSPLAAISASAPSVSPATASNPLSDQLLNASNEANQRALGVVSQFRNNKFVSGTKEFLESNTMVAKLSFFILVVIGFILLLRVGTRILQTLFSPSESPYLIDGMKDGKKYFVITQNPNKNSSIPILRSNNEDKGIEFTYNTWIYIDDLNYQKNKRKHIFHKGSNNLGGTDNADIAFPNNAPGLYLHENKNTLVVIINTFDEIIEEVEIDNIPLNKWINVTIRVEQRNMDVFINGNVAKRHRFNSVPKQNYGSVHVNKWKGFSGYLSNLRYYNKALNGTEINSIVKKGPNLKMTDSMNIFPPYFSLNWFFNQNDS